MLWRQKCGADVLPHNAGLEELEEPMCLSSPSSCDGNRLYWDLCEITTLFPASDLPLL